MKRIVVICVLIVFNREWKCSGDWSYKNLDVSGLLSTYSADIDARLTIVRLNTQDKVKDFSELLTLHIPDEVSIGRKVCSSA